MEKQIWFLTSSGHYHCVKDDTPAKSSDGSLISFIDDEHFKCYDRMFAYINNSWCEGEKVSPPQKYEYKLTVTTFHYYDNCQEVTEAVKKALRDLQDKYESPIVSFNLRLCFED